MTLPLCNSFSHHLAEYPHSDYCELSPTNADAGFFSHPSTISPTPTDRSNTSSPSQYLLDFPFPHQHIVTIYLLLVLCKSPRSRFSEQLPETWLINWQRTVYFDQSISKTSDNVNKSSPTHLTQTSCSNAAHKSISGKTVLPDKHNAQISMEVR